jgi:two-component system phosphate regulon response regulator PhoB
MLTNDSIASRASASVLLAAEDGSFNAFVIYVFQQIGVQVVAEQDGKRLDRRLSELKPDVLLVDSRLAGVDVRTLCAQLRLERETRSLAILVLLASGDERRREEFLASRADECLERPLMPEKLVARVLAALRHAARHSEAPQVLTFHDVEIDLAAYVVRRNGQVIHLGPTEFRRYLAASHIALGHSDEAQKSVQRAIELDPDESIRKMTSPVLAPYKNLADLEPYREHLRKAGAAGVMSDERTQCLGAILAADVVGYSRLM